MNDNFKTHPRSMDGTSLDVAEENRARLRALFPTVFTETRDENGNLVGTVDFEKLKAELGTFTDLFEARRERYGLDWPGKKENLRAIQTPTYATLKPAKEESVAWDTTENLFVEGDNLEALKLLQKAYYGKVRMIYIDPPYNTGSDFIYPDNYSESLETYLAYAGLSDDAGNRIESKKNTVDDGRFHTKWMNMMYPRMYLARNLLRDDGVVFISIDDAEVSNLRHLCDEIFGAENFCAQIVWEGANKNDARQVGISHEYVLLYAKNRSLLPREWSIKKEGVEPVLAEVERLRKEYGDDYDTASKELAGWFRAMKAKPSFAHRRFRYIDAKGVYKEDDPTAPGGRRFELLNPNTGEVIPLRRNRGWGFDQTEFNRLVSEDRITFITPTSIMVRRYLHETDALTPPSVFYQPARSASERLTKLMDGNVFDFPKDEETLKNFVEMATDPTDDDCVVMDFFAGSGTTAQAVLMQNLADGGKRKYVLVQLPEPLDPEVKEQKAGAEYCDRMNRPRVLSELTKERLRRVGKLFERNDDQLTGSTLDSGFRILKLDKSNFRQWQKLGSEATADLIAEQLELHVEHVDPSATQEDLLFEILLKAGFRPTEKAELIDIAGMPAYSIAGGALLICLAPRVTKELIDAVAEAEPMHFFCLDSAFGGNDQLKANAVQTFAARNQGREKAAQIVFRTV